MQKCTENNPGCHSVEPRLFFQSVRLNLSRACTSRTQQIEGPKIVALANISRYGKKFGHIINQLFFLKQIQKRSVRETCYDHHVLQAVKIRDSDTNTNDRIKIDNRQTKPILKLIIVLLFVGLSYLGCKMTISMSNVVFVSRS